MSSLSDLKIKGNFVTRIYIIHFKSNERSLEAASELFNRQINLFLGKFYMGIIGLDIPSKLEYSC